MNSIIIKQNIFNQKYNYLKNQGTKMKISAAIDAPSNAKQWVIFCTEGKTVAIPDKELNDLAAEAIQAKLFSSKDGQILPIFKGGKVAILIGAGKEADSLSMRKLGSMTKSALKTKPLSPGTPVVIKPLDDCPEAVRAIIDGAMLGLYKWDKYISQDDDKDNGGNYNDLDITILTSHSDVVDQAVKITNGVNLARDLSNENADVAHSVFLEKQIKQIAESDSRCTIEILNRSEMQEEGLNLHLAVNQGSNKEPKLIIVTYRGGNKNDPFVALVGKGITFDSGGLNLKPTGSMETMRMDMCGTAAVIGSLRNTLELNIPGNIYFVCAIAENAIGASSYKPGDVIISYSGKSVEICNTDAEGRLVLADANSYIAKNYKPDAIINIATLTGAVVMALGYEYTGLMSSDRTLADNLLNAANATDDRAWELPIYPELKDHVKSKVADIKNTGESRCAGTISAGEFLRQFAQCESKDQKWAHLDIAGTSKPSKDIAYLNNGATGAGVRLLTRFLLDRSKSN